MSTLVSSIPFRWLHRSDDGKPARSDVLWGLSTRSIWCRAMMIASLRDPDSGPFAIDLAQPFPADGSRASEKAPHPDLDHRLRVERIAHQVRLTRARRL